MVRRNDDPPSSSARTSHLARFPVPVNMYDGTNIAGRFSITRLLSTGSALTFLGVDSSNLRRIVVKVALPGSRHSALCIERESSIITKLAHVNIVEHISSGVLKDGCPYLVTEYINGTSLSDAISHEAFGVELALSVIYSVGEAIKSLHEAGFIHRDIKPSNVMLKEFSVTHASVGVKLIDLGSAGVLDKAAMTSSVGEVFGSPYYMAPEQLAGGAQSPATDVFGLGALLLEMLIGSPKLPYRRISDALLTIGVAKLPTSNGELSAKLHRFLRTCLSANPAERPRSAEDFLRQIRSFQLAFSTVLERHGFSNGQSSSAGYATIVPSYGYSREAGLIEKRLLGIFAGVLLFAGGIWSGYALRAHSDKETPQIAREAQNLRARAAAVGKLTDSIDTDIETLLSNMWKDGTTSFKKKTVALFMKEYQEAKDSKDRLNAINLAINLLDDIEERSTPWYAKYKDIIGAFVALTGAITGIITIIISIRKKERSGMPAARYRGRKSP